MRPHSPSLFHLRRHFSASFSTQIKPPQFQNPTSPINHNFDPFHYLQSISTQIKNLLRNPRNHYSLTTLDSLLAKTHLLNSATSLIVIDYLSQIKKLGRAKTLLSNLKATGKVSDYFLYSLVFDCLVKDGKIDDVGIVWTEICESQPTTSQRIDISNYVIAVCKFGGVDEIKCVCERILMGGRGLEKQSYVALIGALCKVNEGLLAKEVVVEMYSKGMKVDDWTYFVMFQCFCRNGNLDEADLILRKLVGGKTFHIDICIYGSFLHALCKLGKFREANKLFRKLIKRDCADGTKKRVILKEGRRAIFQLDCEGNVPEILAYESYFRAMCNVGKVDEAEVLLKKMMKSRTMPEICVYGSFIKALFCAGRDEDAMKFFKVERKKGLVRIDEVARYIIMGLCGKGKIDDALKFFDEIVRTNGLLNCSSVCNCILGNYWKEGRVVEAESLFERFQESNYELPNLVTYTIMVNGYCNHGDVSKALCIFEEMLKSKMVVSGALYEMLVRGLCNCGREREAFKYLNDMIEDGHLVFVKRWKTLFHSTFTTIEDDTSVGS